LVFAGSHSHVLTPGILDISLYLAARAKKVSEQKKIKGRSSKIIGCIKA